MTERRARRRPGENRARLLEAGIVVFGKHGFHGASTSDIARLAEVPQPHVYQHFSAKSALFLSCVEVMVSRLSARCAAPTAQSAVGTTDQPDAHTPRTAAHNSGAPQAGAAQAVAAQAVVHHGGVKATSNDLRRFHFQAITLTGDTHYPVDDGVSSLLTALRDMLSQDEWEQLILAGARLFTRDTATPGNLT